MFDIGWSEMAVLLLVALIVIGPRDLPKVARTVGRWVGKARAMARDFQRSFEDMVREAELDDIRKEIDRVGRDRIDLGRTIGGAVDPDGSLSRALAASATAGSANQSGALASGASVASASEAAGGPPTDAAREPGPPPTSTEKR